MYAYENNLSAVVLVSRKKQVPKGRRCVCVKQVPVLEAGYAWRINWETQTVEAILTGIPADQDAAEQEKGGLS